LWGGIWRQISIVFVQYNLVHDMLHKSTNPRRREKNVASPVSQSVSPNTMTG
jgi:hypothetical protein